MECVFSGIRDGRLAATQVAENEGAFAIMDINPIKDGHVLIVTKAHVEDLSEVSEPDLMAAARLSRRVAIGIRTVAERIRAVL